MISMKQGPVSAAKSQLTNTPAIAVAWLGAASSTNSASTSSTFTLLHNRPRYKSIDIQI